VAFIDNQPVLDLIEKKPYGLLPMLDEEIRLPQGADAKWLSKCETNHAAHSAWVAATGPRLQEHLTFFTVKVECCKLVESRVLDARVLRTATSACMGGLAAMSRLPPPPLPYPLVPRQHYAGAVRYDSVGFCEKNRDSLSSDLYTVMSNSTDAMNQALFPPLDKSAAVRRMIVSIAGQFRKQLTTLMEVVDHTQPHYIRCARRRRGLVVIVADLTRPSVPPSLPPFTSLRRPVCRCLWPVFCMC
jgi:hypothetical protein